MAADLVESSKIPHKLEHDLESFFWVILWIVMTRVPNNWTDEARASLINNTMSPRVYSHSGGTAKKSWLVAEPLNDFQIPHNPTLGSLMTGLLSSVAARHRPPPSNPIPKIQSKDPYLLVGHQLRPETTADTTEHFQKGLEFLKDHNVVTQQFEIALREEWPPDDEARPLGIMRPDSVVDYSHSSTKRALSAVGGGFNKESASKRHTGHG